MGDLFYWHTIIINFKHIQGYFLKEGKKNLNNYQQIFLMVKVSLQYI